MEAAWTLSRMEISLRHGRHATEIGARAFRSGSAFAGVVVHQIDELETDPANIYDVSVF